MLSFFQVIGTNHLSLTVSVRLLLLVWCISSLWMHSKATVLSWAMGEDAAVPHASFSDVSHFGQDEAQWCKPSSLTAGISPWEDIKGALLLCCMSNLLTLLKVRKNNHNPLQRAFSLKKGHTRKRASQVFSWSCALSAIKAYGEWWTVTHRSLVTSHVIRGSL